MVTTEDIVSMIKDAGQSLIDNAESIAGDYKYQTHLNIDIDIAVTGNEVSTISVNTDFVPEKTIERLKATSILN